MFVFLDTFLLSDRLSCPHHPIEPWCIVNPKGYIFDPNGLLSLWKKKLFAASLSTNLKNLDVALYTDPEEIYLVRKDGHVFMYDATKTVEKVKITNPLVRSKDKVSSYPSQWCLTAVKIRFFFNFYIFRNREEIIFFIYQSNLYSDWGDTRIYNIENGFNNNNKLHAEYFESFAEKVST